jgi:hypothetical protein
MIRGQFFWAFLLFLSMLLLALAFAFKRAHAPLISNANEILLFELLYALAIGVTCIRVQRRLGMLQGQAEQKSIANISQGVYVIVAFSYLALMFLTMHVPLR